MIINLLNILGRKAIELTIITGNALYFLLQIVVTFFSTSLRLKNVIYQMEKIGVGSFTIVFLTGASSGLALALQTYIGLSRFGGEEFIGIVVALGMTRELAPVLTGLMVMARAGSAIAAELGTMKVTEQVDALKTLCINPLQYLVVPRITAAFLIMPLLTAISMLCGITGGYYYSIHILELNAEQYLAKIQANIELNDIVGGLVKGGAFGIIIVWIGSFFGYNTEGGAKDVGISTTQSVVVGSILILLANYLLSSLLFTAEYA